MTRRDRTTTARARRQRGGLVALPLLLGGLFAACGGQSTDAATDQHEDPAEADDSSSSVRHDAGTRAPDAGKKGADGGTASSTKDASAAPATSPDSGKKMPATSDDAGSTPSPSSSSDAGSMTMAPTGGDICAQWKAARVSLSEGTWSGNSATCDAGDMTEDARANALRLFNFYRTAVGLAPVTTTPEGNRLAQNCAALMNANGTITHTPPSTWKCYTDEAAKTASSSSISSGPAVSSVDGYMIDPGNPTTIGHRRWILSNLITDVGFGSAGNFSCQYQPAKYKTSGAKPWVAWPPAGQVPVQALGGRFVGTVDQTGWTVQSDTVNLANAQVSVTSDGMDLPVTITQLGAGYGSMYALRFGPMGWTSAAGKTYHVKLSGTSMPIEYDVQIVDCP